MIFPLPPFIAPFLSSRPIIALKRSSPLTPLIFPQELFSKLRFSYLEQVTKEKFLRSIVGEPPLIVEHQENVELEVQLAEVKKVLREQKEGVAGLVRELEGKGREICRRECCYDQLRCLAWEHTHLHGIRDPKSRAVLTRHLGGLTRLRNNFPANDPPLRPPAANHLPKRNPHHPQRRTLHHPFLNLLFLLPNTPEQPIPIPPLTSNPILTLHAPNRALGSR